MSCGIRACSWSMFGQWHIRQLLRVFIFVLILAAMTLLSLNQHHTTVQREPKNACPEISDLLQRIHELSALQENLGVKNCEPPSLDRIEEKPNGTSAPLTAPPRTPKPTQFAYEDSPDRELLDPTFVPNNVIYVWCGKRWFEFIHYLSVKSVIRQLRPDNIIFYYDYEPVVDSWTYNTWFKELQDEYPFFRKFAMNEEYSKMACNGFSKVNPEFVTARLTEMGGMYVHESTVLTSFPLEYRKLAVVHGLNETNMSGFLMTRRGYPGSASLDSLIKSAKFDTKQLDCAKYDGKAISNTKAECLNLNSYFFPKDIWELNTDFGRIIRKIFYGSEEINLPKQDYNELIPNIAHMVWLGGGEMDFLFYLSVLSLIYVAKVDMVYMHGDAPPTGPYWNRLRHNPKLTLVYRMYQHEIYGQRINILSHVTDVWRVDFMIKYGGIYVDTDTVFVKELDRDIRAYDAVGAYDWTYWNHPFPDTINYGVAIGKKNAKYWQKFQESMKWFMDKDWSWNGLRQPYRIKERHPELVRIDPSLQVICFESLCHPTWYPDYHNESVHHLNSNPINNWRTDVYAFHWTLPTPVELKSPRNLLNTNSIFSEIGQHVLEEAGLLEAFRKEVSNQKNNL
ncbi:hypothetical protein CAPTEDRAFT_200575 [Capitella teleta]|uniref:Alpha 1,4-glycosyltransferase domain-containing protein n=1 Tax=Capitella teleta TaxID=283909 RepID=R7T885_CAPTE|nr:hypothetical protein CAPTEDRAFT_200575 [Capitella teleta]|eukprot:ELT89884.1 hypothetical protein CAPTEDRAFT_200575 [Capitella teleta]